MKINIKGVDDNSDIVFHSPSRMALDHFFYPICAGHFFCDRSYHLEREDFKSILIMHIIKGTCIVRTKNCTKKAVAGDTVILNCTPEHEYYAASELETMWFHFDGQNSEELCDILTLLGTSPVIHTGDGIRAKLDRLISLLMSGGPIDEITLSELIYTTVCGLFSPSHDSISDFSEDNIALAKDYILDHLSEKLTVADIASAANMSPSNFSRAFHEKTGFSPYDYVLNMRLKTAKDLLRCTDRKISDIAYKTGFNSESNFIYTFTKNVGMSPAKFRKVGF